MFGDLEGLHVNEGEKSQVCIFCGAGLCRLHC
jgi:hypothetical protein